MGNRYAYSPLTILAVIRDHQSGLPAVHVGKRYGVSANTVIRWTKQWGDEAEALPNLANVHIQLPSLSQ